MVVTGLGAPHGNITIWNRLRTLIEANNYRLFTLVSGFIVLTIGEIIGNTYNQTTRLEIAGDSLENTALASMLYAIASTRKSERGRE